LGTRKTEYRTARASAVTAMKAAEPARETAYFDQTLEAQGDDHTVYTVHVGNMRREWLDSTKDIYVLTLKSEIRDEL
jgi:hypothetical protein